VTDGALGLERRFAGPAEKLQDGNAPGDTAHPATLIGPVETIEGTAASSFLKRRYSFNLDTDGLVVPTAFLPLPIFP
jgi:hypothetical protein